MRKRIMLFMLLVISLIISGCNYVEQQEVKSTVLETVNSQEVIAIKNMMYDGRIKLGDLLESGLSSCSYELYDPAEDGNTYVTVSGNVEYNGVPIVATLQYKKISEENYEFYTLVYNDIPQNKLEVVNFYNYLLTSYDEQMNSALTEDTYNQNSEYSDVGDTGIMLESEGFPNESYHVDVDGLVSNGCDFSNSKIVKTDSNGYVDPNLVGQLLWFEEALPYRVKDGGALSYEVYDPTPDSDGWANSVYEVDDNEMYEDGMDYSNCETVMTDSKGFVDPSYVGKILWSEGMIALKVRDDGSLKEVYFRPDSQ